MNDDTNPVADDEEEREFIDLSEWAATTPGSVLLSSAAAYPGAMEALRPMVAQYLDHINGDDDDEEFSSDAFYQLLQDASGVCMSHDVPSEDRVELICDAIREHAYDRIDQEIDHLKWQITLFRDL